MQKFANPTTFLKLANAILPYLWVITAALFALGLYGAFVTSPADYQQGESVRIMYIHVPASWIGMFAYGLMAFASAIALIFRHRCPHWRSVLFSSAGHGFHLGQAHLGHVVGVGCAHHLHVYSIVALCWLHRHLAGH